MCFVYVCTVYYAYLQVGYMLLVAAALLGRTYCDLWMIKNNTATEAYVVVVM